MYKRWRNSSAISKCGRAFAARFTVHLLLIWKRRLVQHVLSWLRCLVANSHGTCRKAHPILPVIFAALFKRLTGRQSVKIYPNSLIIDLQQGSSIATLSIHSERRGCGLWAAQSSLAQLLNLTAHIQRLERTTRKPSRQRDDLRTPCDKKSYARRRLPDSTLIYVWLLTLPQRCHPSRALRFLLPLRAQHQKHHGRLPRQRCFIALVPFFFSPCIFSCPIEISLSRFPYCIIHMQP